MRLFNNVASVFSTVLFYLVIAVCIVPNAVLCVTEQMPPLYAAVNILLPAGVYWTFMSLSSHVGRSVLWMFIIMFLSAFEIVLLDLYGNSVIGVDMWLNVVTTNSNEIGELLGNLLPVIVLVCLLYLPPLAVGIVALVRKWRLTGRFMRVNRAAGAATALCGVLLMVVGIVSGGYMSPVRYIFPVNAVDNALIASERYRLTSRYHDTSRGFSYGARSEHPDSLREVYVLVVGETSRAANWEMLGYGRATNPELKGQGGAVAFGKVLSESNTTHKSVPLLLSSLTADSFGDSIYSVKGIVTAFKEAGFHTVFLSNEERNGSFIDFFGEEADESLFVKEQAGDRYLRDECLLEYLDSALSRHGEGRIMVVLHTYGSHFNYRERYSGQFSHFRPDDASEARRENREMLLNAYDNSIRYTSHLLSRIMSRLADDGSVAAMLYTSDHGEDIYDDDRGLFLHASPRPSAYQLHVPYLVWTSDAYNSAYPRTLENAVRNLGKNVSSSRSFFHTALDLAGIGCGAFDPAASVVNDLYAEPERRYLTDHNEAVPLDSSGLADPDFRYFSDHGIASE